MLLNRMKVKKPTQKEERGQRTSRQEWRTLCGLLWTQGLQRAGWKGGGRGEERGNNKEKTTREDACQKCCVSAVHSSPTLQVRESESGKYRVPIKEGREEKEKEGRGGKTHAGSLSWPIETQWSGSEFYISSWWARGALNPHLSSLLLQQSSFLSPPFLCSPSSLTTPQPPTLAASLIGGPTVLDLVLCVGVSVSVWSV